METSYFRRKKMKKLFVLLSALVFIVGFVTIASCNSLEPPEMIVLSNTLEGEIWFNPLDRYVMTKTDIPLYAVADETSTLSGTLRSNKLAKITAYETHTFPLKNKVVMNGQTYYLLAYRGEGSYTAWTNGTIVKRVDMNTNIVNTDAAAWLCVNNPDTGVSGWINLNGCSRDTFFREGPNGIYLNVNNLHENNSTRWK
jgi:hypothetical protein